MRPKVIAATMLLALGIWGLAMLASWSLRQKPAATPAVMPPVAQAQTEVAQPPISVKPSPPLIPVPVTSTAVVAVPTLAGNEATHAELVNDRVTELMKLAMNNDPESLNTIWAELSNPDKEIRAGALSAVVQFGDRSVTPRLRELAAQTDDPREKLDILAAADQLDLPSLGSLPPNQSTNAPQ